MIGCIFTSLKVVSIAVVFLASTSLREMVLRRFVIFSAFSLRLLETVPGLLPGFSRAASTSSFNILPSGPLGVIFLVSTFFSAMIAAATGVAFISADGFVLGVIEASSFLVSFFVLGAGEASVFTSDF
jgi:hypothetical protein